MAGSVNKEAQAKTCPHCGRGYPRPKRITDTKWEARIYCSKPCAGKNTPVRTGPDHPLWKGGMTKTKDGYQTYTNSPHNGGYAGMTQHRTLMQKKLGRRLKRSEHVHHIDGDKSNNSLENLTVLSATDHARYHAIQNKLGQKRNA